MLARRRRPAGFFVLPAAALVAVALAGCGGSGGGPSAPQAPASPATAPALTVTITATGVTPRELSVPLGSEVRFVNQDNRSHQMMSDPHPLHTGCVEINAVGMLARGESRTTAPLTGRKACGFHDNIRDGDTSLRGVILVGGADRDPNYDY
jgi:plastocyanin